MKVAKNIFIDLDKSQISESLHNKLLNHQLYDYKDTILKEHIFGVVEGICNRAQEQALIFNERESRELADLGQVMNKAKAAYFRIIYP